MPLHPDALFTPCDPSLFDFDSTEELEPLDHIFGQERALEAIAFATQMKHKGFNLFVMGPSGSGKHSLIMRHLGEKAAQEPTPREWCYVNNFDDERKPIALSFAPGESRGFKEAMKALMSKLKTRLPKLFESDSYHQQKAALEAQISQQQNEILSALSDQARDFDVAMSTLSTSQVNFVPVHEGKRLSAEEFDALEGEAKSALTRNMQAFEQIVKTRLIDITRLGKALDEQLDALDEGLTRESVKSAMESLHVSYGADEKCARYLRALEADLIENAGAFIQKNSAADEAGLLLGYAQEHFERYEVNCFITHEAHAPVIYEDNPVHQNLIGRIEHDSRMGTLYTDFTMITPGALHRASGGYLVLDARRILLEPFAWEELKRVLQSHEVRIESLNRQYGFIDTATLDPEAIPVELKVVLIGERELYYLLHEFDPDFGELFKVSADFEDDLERSHENIMLYARMIGSVVRDNDLLPLDAPAVARVIEQSARDAEHAARISTHMRSLADLLKEGDHLARTVQQTLIQTHHIDAALEARRARMGRVQRRLYAQIQEGDLLISVTGSEVGMINGLSYLSLGGYAFGMPSRISARTRIGQGEIIDIERKVELGGALHSKGVMILSAYLGATYAADIALSLSASLTFEQNYGHIDGDSASSAELYALLSSLSNLPIRQNFAVTGSVNQFGIIQSIGGVNEKIEGFFDVCTALDPQGRHGVLIPHSNVKHLMLPPKIREACAQGRFEVHAVRTVDEGIALLTCTEAGVKDKEGHYPKGSVNERVMSTLKRYAKNARARR
ncbi:MAG: AAA family ATPase [Campylobacterales bacterium]|nr:AAA family ATPase [Campylobacterales bacterium]